MRHPVGLYPVFYTLGQALLYGCAHQVPLSIVLKGYFDTAYLVRFSYQVLYKAQIDKDIFIIIFLLDAKYT